MFPDLSSLYPSLTPLPQLLLHTLVFRTGILTHKQAVFLAGMLRPEKADARRWHKANRLSAEAALEKLIKLGLIEQASIPAPPYFRGILQRSPAFKWTDEERDLVAGKEGDESSIVDFEADTELEFLDRGERSVYYAWKPADHRFYEVTKGPPGMPLLHFRGGNTPPWRGTRCIDVFLPTPAACELREGLPNLPVWELEVGDFYARFMPDDEPPRPPLANPPKRPRRSFSIRGHVRSPFKPDRFACHIFNVSCIYFVFLDYLPDREALSLKKMKDPLTQFYPLRKKAEVAERWIVTGCPRSEDLLRNPIEAGAPQGQVSGSPSQEYRANRERWTLRLPDAYVMDEKGRPHTAIAFGITYSEQLRRKFYSFCREHNLDCLMF